MKYRLQNVFALLIALILLCGCGAKSPAGDPVTEGFSCRAAIRYGEMDIDARLTCTPEGSMTVAFALPKSLSGVVLGWNGTDMTLELGGMSLALPAEKVPESALVRCLAQVLGATHPTGTRTEEGYVISGETEGKAYALVCDPATGLPVSLSVPEEGLEATFTETQLYKNATE